MVEGNVLVSDKRALASVLSEHLDFRVTNLYNCSAILFVVCREVAELAGVSIGRVAQIQSMLESAEQDALLVRLMTEL